MERQLMQVGYIATLLLEIYPSKTFFFFALPSTAWYLLHLGNQTFKVSSNIVLSFTTLTLLNLLVLLGFLQNYPAFPIVLGISFSLGLRHTRYLGSPSLGVGFSLRFHIPSR